MDNDIKSWLYDILNAINEIDSFTNSASMDFVLYENDVKTQRAVERNIEIIGEAMNRILKTNVQLFITDARKFVDVRNRIIHGYDSVSNEIIWSIVINNLPLLKGEVDILLNE